MKYSANDRDLKFSFSDLFAPLKEQKNSFKIKVVLPLTVFDVPCMTRVRRKVPREAYVVRSITTHLLCCISN